jgi:hypothetical protein
MIKTDVGFLSSSPIWGGGYHTIATLERAYDLYRRPKEEQLRAICDAHGLCHEKVMKAKRFVVRKSGNRIHHPATYILEVVHDNPNDIKKGG